MEPVRAAIAQWETAARRHVAAHELLAAANAYANAARLALRAGDGSSALHAADAGLQLHVAGVARSDLLIVRARALDCLDDPHAAFAWSDAGLGTQDAELAELCFAHSTGAMIKHGIAALDTARILVTSTQHPGAAHEAALLGALGESAGRAGVPFLIQAVTVMHRQGALTPETIVYWEALLALVGDDLSLGLCALGVALLAGSPKREALHARVLAAIERCAAARAITLEALLTDAVAFAHAHDVLAELRQLAGPEHWLLS